MPSCFVAFLVLFEVEVWLAHEFEQNWLLKLIQKAVVPLLNSKWVPEESPTNSLKSFHEVFNSDSNH